MTRDNLLSVALEIIDMATELETANDRIAELETANEALYADIRKMKEEHESKSVFLAQLERFGYMLTAIGQTAKEARDAVINRYTISYMDIHGRDPKDDQVDESRSYLDLANEEICITEMTFGTVEWM